MERGGCKWNAVAVVCITSEVWRESERKEGKLEARGLESDGTWVPS